MLDRLSLSCAFYAVVTDKLSSDTTSVIDIRGTALCISWADPRSGLVLRGASERSSVVCLAMDLYGREGAHMGMEAG